MSITILRPYEVAGSRIFIFIVIIVLGIRVILKNTFHIYWSYPWFSKYLSVLLNISPDHLSESWNIIFSFYSVGKKLIKTPISSLSPYSSIGTVRIPDVEILIFNNLGTFYQQQISKVFVTELTAPPLYWCEEDKEKDIRDILIWSLIKIWDLLRLEVSRLAGSSQSGYFTVSLIFYLVFHTQGPHQQLNIRRHFLNLLFSL